MKRAVLLCVTTLAIARKAEARPKGFDSRSCVPSRQNCAQMGSGAKHPPEATQNRHTEWGNPSRALSELALNEVKGL